MTRAGQQWWRNLLPPSALESKAVFSHRRWALWALLVALVGLMLVILVWLAGRHESAQVQSRLDQSALDAAIEIRSGLTRNLQTLQALQQSVEQPEGWRVTAADLLRRHREIVRLESRAEDFGTLAVAETPFRDPVFSQLRRDDMRADVALTCSSARRLNGAAYSNSYFLPQSNGLGLEVIDMCMPRVIAGRLAGYTLAIYALEEVLGELISSPLSRGVGLAFTEADGTRLAMRGVSSAGSRVYVAQQLLDLPGNTLVMRMESRLGTPALFPNVLTALVLALSLALMAVLFLLARDMRRRQQVEHDLADALAFRKAMEDSLSTGLRARDLQGRITYVNPAFCAMVGIEARELLNQTDRPLQPSPDRAHLSPASRQTSPPYWPPELAAVYQQRQEKRLAGNNLPQGGYESVFMRRDGTRFPVLIIEAPLINAVGKHTGWMSAVLDVSEQRRVEELSRTSQDRLQATARLAMVGEMASLLSHELNQPLAAISSYAAGSLNVLQASQGPGYGVQPLTTDDAGDLQMAMQRIASEAERAGKVIKSVHDFVRRREQVREAVDPQKLFDAIMPLVSLQARKLGVQIVTHIYTAGEQVLCDRTMVEQVLLNLARNGMQAMQAIQVEPAKETVGAHGDRLKTLTLTIRASTSQHARRWLEFGVADCGEGISSEVAAQLFTPFFTTKVEGMGLGLSLCRTVIEQHGGALVFEPAQPRGTVFRFTLPVADIEAGTTTMTRLPAAALHNE